MFPTGSPSAQIDNFHSYDPIAQHAQLLGGHIGKVDDAAADEGPAVVDAHSHRFAVAQIDHLDDGAELEAAMGGRHGILIVALAAGRGPVVKLMRVVAGQADLLQGRLRPDSRFSATAG